MKLLLTEEEIDKLADEQRKADGLPTGAWLDSIDPKRIAKAQLSKIRNSPELEEEIAKKLCELDGWKWDGLNEVYKHFFDSTTQSDYHNRAKSVLALIKEDE